MIGIFGGHGPLVPPPKSALELMRSNCTVLSYFRSLQKYRGYISAADNGTTESHSTDRSGKRANAGK